MTLLEMRIQVQNEDFNAIDAKAQSVINVTGLVAALVSGFGLIPDRASVVSIIGLIVVMLIFGIVLIFALQALQVQNWKRVLDFNNVDEFVQNHLPRIEEAADSVYLKDVSTMYAGIITHNQEILDRKVTFLEKAWKAMAIELVVVFAYAVILLLLKP